MNSPITRRALRVYAALSELGGRDHGDVLDSLTPFFEPILEAMNGHVYDPQIFAVGVKKLYRWKFTADIAHQLIPKFVAQGYLTLQGRTREGSIYTVSYQRDHNNIAQNTPIEDVVSAIIEEFEKFPPRVTDLLSYNRTREQLKDILIRFLVSMDSHGEGAYQPQLGSLEPLGDARTILDQLDEGGTPLDSNDRYMCARFVSFVMKTKPEFAEHLTRLASIALLTEVVEDFLKPTQAVDRSSLTIILDAPLALDYLGCSGGAAKDDTKLIVSELQKIGVKFIVLPVSCEEMKRNLDTMLSLEPHLRHGPTHRAIVRGQVDLKYIQAVAKNPQRALEQAGIVVRPLDLKSFPSLHHHFSNDVYEDFLSSIGWVTNISAREHDATCTAITMRPRDGKSSNDILNCNYVVVTRNFRFVEHSRGYVMQSRMVNPLHEGPVIHQRELATIAWLRTGLGADESIPRGHLIATCDRVLAIRPEVRQALATELAKITPERLDQLNLLMLDARSIQKLTDETLNDDRIVSAENAERLLDLMKEATAEELQERYERQLSEERSASQKRLEAEIAARESEIEKVRRAAIESAERHTEAVAALAEARRAEANRIVDAAVAIVKRLNNNSVRIERALTALLVLVGLIAVLNYFTSWMEIYRFWIVIAGLGALFGLYRLICGILERPSRGLVTILNNLNSILVSRRLRGINIPDNVVKKCIRTEEGRVFLEENELRDEILSN